LKLNWALPVAILIGGESSRLSLTVPGSSTNAAFGDVSKAGAGLPEFEVSHSGAAPCALFAVQPVGNAGAVTPSKFSWNIGDDIGITETTGGLLESPRSASFISAVTVAYAAATGPMSITANSRARLSARALSILFMAYSSVGT
jgi:hypothetical protein